MAHVRSYDICTLLQFAHVALLSSALALESDHRLFIHARLSTLKFTYSAQGYTGRAMQ